MTGKRHPILVYKRKEDAPTSYYLIEGNKDIFPARVCINRFPFAPIHGVKKKQAIGQFKATFKKCESSAYRNDKGTLHTSIWKPIRAIPGLLGTGDIRGTDDLLLFFSHDEWLTIEIHIFPGCLFNEAGVIDFIEKNPGQ